MDFVHPQYVNAFSSGEVWHFLMELKKAGRPEQSSAAAHEFPATLVISLPRKATPKFGWPGPAWFHDFLLFMCCAYRSLSAHISQDVHVRRRISKESVFTARHLVGVLSLRRA